MVIEPALVIAAFTVVVGVVLLKVLFAFKTSAFEDMLVIAAFTVVFPALIVRGPDAK